MKLKQAKKKARKLSLSWVAVDGDQKVYGYESIPSMMTSADEWFAPNSAVLLSEEDYSGSKNWRATLREVS